jgi:diguanylate cyclase (GGDEF)-like protein
MLPGNVPIYEHIDQLLATQSQFYVAYCDLNNFKPYNDYFGYDKGDDVLRRLGECLLKICHAERDFIGHIGGDDFIAIFTSEDWEARLRQGLLDFEHTRHQFYDELSLQNQGIWGKDRSGNSQFFELLTLAIGVVNPDPARCNSHHDIASLAVEAKRNAKRIGGNSIFVSRRRGPVGDKQDRLAAS